MTLQDLPTPLSLSRVIWKKEVEKKWSIKIRGKEVASWTLNGSVALVEENGTFYVELEIEGERARFALADACFPFQYLVFKLEACFANLVFDGNTPKSFDIVINACIDASVKLPVIGRVGIKECVNLFKERITFFMASGDSTLGGSSDILSAPDAYYEGALEVTE